ncbi:hypothetical protein NC651_008086 [Populus alba x Populus x berolinensis]|nr:hypothetical protein NC651_008086 [Populus alba x Populus x berolinensis]
MGPRILVFLVVALSQVCTIPAMTDGADFTALKALKDIWKNVPPTWVGADPCGSRWEGILCANSRVTSMDLSYNKGLSGPLPSAIGDLKKLTNLVLVGCSFRGPIPDSIGSLPLLASLSLNSNGFTGSIPPSIGNLTSLYLLDLADNRLTGTIPVSTATTPGLDLLVHTKHFHLGLNQLSGTIPPKLFSSEMKLIHVLFESNKLTGSIPSTLGLVKTLEVVRLDNNSFRGSVPSSINSLTSVSTMFLSNNDLTGPLPNLTGMPVLTYLDMSNNSFDDTEFPPWLSTLQSLTTLVMETTQLQGQIPADFFSLSHLQTVDARNNQLSGSLDIGTGHGNQLALIDLRKNQISAYTNRLGGEGVSVILADNPICKETGVTKSYCTVSQPNSSYATPPNNCVPASCFATQHSSPNCKCSFPYTGLLVFRAPSFSDLGNITYFSVLEKSLMNSFKSHQFPVDSVHLSQPRKDLSQYLDLNLQVFPFGQDRFNRTAILSIGFMLSSQTFKPPSQFGPFFFIGDTYLHFTGEVRGSKKSSSTGAIIGAAAGGSVLLLLLLGAGLYAFGQKTKAEKAIQQNSPFAHWESKNGFVSVPQLKGARCFSFEELKKYTNNFSETIDIGSGGYGKVYRGVLPTGQLITIKRALRGWMQPGLEFKTEIELLSRVHHRNVVSLVGFCLERGEQMLIYKFVSNGSLMESLSADIAFLTKLENQHLVGLHGGSKSYRGARMDGSQALVVYQHSNGAPSLQTIQHFCTKDVQRKSFIDFSYHLPGSEPAPPRITSNVKQNLQFLKLWKEFQKRKSSTPKPSTSYRRKKVEKEDLPEDTELYRDPTLSLYYTNQIVETGVPVLLVDGYNVCGYWAKLKKHFVNGRLDIARQKLIDELVAFSLARDVKVVVVFDAMMSGLPTHKENFVGVDVIFTGESCADAWIEKEVVALKEDGCPKVWVVTSDHIQQHAAHGAGAFIWSCKALVSEIKTSQQEVERALQELRLASDMASGIPTNLKSLQEPQLMKVHHILPTSFQGRLLKHNLDSEVVDALKDLRKKLAENESKSR